MHIRPITLLIFLIFSLSMSAQELFLKTFGDSMDPAILHLHGGPGGNGLWFEEYIAEELASEGFFVISFDRRGEGRSGRFKEEEKPEDVFERILHKPEYPNFTSAFEDIDSIIGLYGLEDITLLGSSFGGVVATLYADTFPDKVDNIILLGSPLNMQASNMYALHESRKHFIEKGDSTKVKQVEWILGFDSVDRKPGLLIYHLAYESGFAEFNDYTEEGLQIRSAMKNDSTDIELNLEVSGSYEQEIPYPQINFLDYFHNLRKKGVSIYGLYGHGDFRYSPAMIEDLKQVVGDNNVLYLEQCGHGVLTDRRTAAIQVIANWVK